MRERDSNDIDVEIIAQSFQAVSDPQVWDKLLDTWHRKIEAVGFAGSPTAVSGDAQIKRHYASIAALLDRVGLPQTVDPIEQAVTSIIQPALAVSPGMRVVAINQAGRETFGAEQGQVVDLSWLCETEQRFLRQFASESGAVENQRYRILRTRWSSARTGLVEIFPVTVTGVAGNFTVVRELTMAWSALIDRVLIEAFGLTQAETEIARLLFVHADTAKVAEARGVGVPTTRLQLSSIYAKTETSDQVELVRLLVLIAARFAEKPGANALRWSDPLGRERLLVRPNGRNVAYSVMGAPKGVPVLFVHGIVNGYLYPTEFQTTLEQNGVTLYAVSRPGAGNSQADPGMDSLADHVQAIETVCKELKLRNVVAAGIHAGVIPLTAMAARRDSPFRAIVAMGRFLPYNARLMSKIAAMPRTLLWLSVHAPWAADIVGRHAWRALAQHGADWYIERAYRDMRFDYETTKRPEILALIRNACAFTFQQGPSIFFDDMRLRSNDIRPFVRTLEIPFHWMLGSEDIYARGARFYDPEDVAAFLALNRRITHEDVPGACELMPYQRPELVARRLVEAASARR